MLAGNNGAIATWNQLALVTEYAGRLEAAEAWYCKAIEGGKAIKDMANVGKMVGNLAELLQNQPNRLSEAWQLAQEALAIFKTIDPAVAEIWKIYNVLAEISDKQHDSTQAQEYRRLSREARAGFAGTRYELRELGSFIAQVVAAADDVEVRQQLEPLLKELAKYVPSSLIASIHQVLEGERDEDVLCEPLDLGSSMFINAILRGIADPETLKPLLEGQE
jgi:tetratricopeptide (TPR) repeat protein